ncbi:MAGE-domain-containing protein [Periconia macrospinosa]|uniref:MAGE-domain-containing protein n=1 Tax=Periconia macrospinosa TaxID=97972 RepID=A0A2V1DT21_9PLEO|nr:MAGE-domain-containing protein [Periconia macrospinosa]
MPPSTRKRRAPADEDPAPTPVQRSRRQEELPDDDPDEIDENEEETQGESGSGSGSIEQLAKGLVRYALACEYSRVPIKRQDIGQKVLGSHTRAFRQVFDAANGKLMDIFGMRMVELPNRDKVTVRQRRAAAAASDAPPKSSNMWVLQSMLPDAYRTPNIVGPGREPPEDEPDTEAAYIGLYTAVIAFIFLSGGTLSEGKLDRQLRRMNADRITPVDSTEKVLARMAREGYIVKIKDSGSGDDVIDYMVGPRGKVEVGKEGAANLVRAVYGDGPEDLEQRLNRSLGLGSEDGEAVHDEVSNAQPAPRRVGRPRRRDSDDDG